LTKPLSAITIQGMENLNLSIKLKNRLADLEKIKTSVAKMYSTIDCTKRKFREIDLILEELFTNVVCHGFSDDKEHDIEVSLACDKKELTIRMEDDGQPFDITAAASPDTRCTLEKRCIGGLGIHLVKHFVDECNYYRKRGKNIVVLKKKISNDHGLEIDSEST